MSCEYEGKGTYLLKRVNSAASVNAALMYSYSGSSIIRDTIKQYIRIPRKVDSVNYFRITFYVKVRLYFGLYWSMGALFKSSWLLNLNVSICRNI